MHFTDLITPDRIVLGVRAKDKGHLLAELAKRAGEHESVPTSAILAALTVPEAL